MHVLFRSLVDRFHNFSHRTSDFGVSVEALSHHTTITDYDFSLNEILLLPICVPPGARRYLLSEIYRAFLLSGLYVRACIQRLCFDGE